ncbi:ULT1 INTERACTING FACTOR 1, HRS1 HOMOLOG5 [Hibiscus trionum]|uniref:ULT1 INTERACTING FACTOR 1, HRS1 HOMOLOG5 n=1 Tax=Hibiscus trionum TaxID=183268 RepID=A0A9W7ILU8_HIBTR|nr:ULT1 INTERACTING FACTOR 1, HRS1 HOMOLOG5 [Hibiscus trionum]
MDLNLSLSSVFVPKSISDFLQEVSKIKNGLQRSSKISDFITRLEDEMKKIDGFKRELPLCMLLLKEVTERLKVEEMLCKGMDEGLPLKKNDGGDKNNWLSSLRLGNSDSDNVDRKKKKPNMFPELNLISGGGGGVVSENPVGVRSNENRGGAFVPFKDVSGLPLMNPSFELVNLNPILKINGGGCAIASSSSMTAEKPQFKFQTKPQQQQQQQQEQRKNRRCWSPDLHRRFVEALELLGGCQAATPKQIKELMHVDGLTNDEVKSHLQKYRLHVRKLPGSSAQKHCTKLMNLQSDSPQGPLIASGKGTSSTGADTMDGEEDEDSDGHSWRMN